MPSSPNYKRNYKQERLNESPKRKKDRAKRNAARKKLGLKVGDPRTAGHKKSLKKGGSNSRSNLKVQSARSNYSHGGRSGSRAGKAAGGRKGKKR